jgi:hypothetical protein
MRAWFVEITKWLYKRFWVLLFGNSPSEAFLLEEKIGQRNYL